MRHIVATVALLLVVGCGQAGAGDHEEQGGHGDEDEHGDEDGREQGVVRIDPSAIARNGIRVAEVRSTVVAGGVDAPAEVQLPPDRVAHVTSLVSGQLQRVEVTVGDTVEEGQVLGTLRSVELGESRGAVAEARAGLELARSNFQRQEELTSEGIGARRNLQEAQGELRRAEAELAAAQRRVSVYGQGGAGANTPIRSPIAGVVLERHATVGEMVSPSTPLFLVGDPSVVWIAGRVYPQDVGRVSAGMPVTLSLQADEERTWSGTLAYVAPALDPDSRTMPVRMVLENPDGALRPGLFGTMTITPTQTGAAPVAAIEIDAVIHLGDQPTVFVPVDEEGEFHAVPVTTGARGGGLLEVREGLSPGDRYVADGAFVLKSELRRTELGHGHAH